MLIGVEKRFVFVANSKTASTSIEAALTPYAEINRVGSPQRKHISWLEARREYAFLFDQPNFQPETFFKFGVVREPADWIRSWFNYRSGNPAIESTLPGEMTFEQFWSGDDWVKNTNQKSKFLDGKGELVFDAILPQDNLAELFPWVAGILGVKVNLPKENKSSGKLPRAGIAKDLWSEINNFYREDYELYLDWKARCKDVLKDIAAITRGCYQLSSISVCNDASQVLHAAIDTLPKAIFPDQAAVIGGVVVLAKEAPDDCTLRMTKAADGSRVGVVTWDIPSPLMAGKYPAAKNAESARFRVEGVEMKLGEDYKLVLYRNGLKLSELFDIRMIEKNAHECP